MWVECGGWCGSLRSPQPKAAPTGHIWGTEELWTEMRSPIRTNGQASVENEWFLVSSRGAVLFHVAAHPECTIKELASAMSLTRRSVWGLIGDLRRAGMIDVLRRGRRHHYIVNLDAPFPHPTVKGYTLRNVLREIVPGKVVERPSF